jgi:hypothetical protein
MTFLPIVDHELRAACRRRGGYWLRSGYGLLGILIALFVFLAYLDSPAQRAGRHLFKALAWLSMPYALLCGIRLTADCLSQEKREGTLGLLFLTDLKGYDVVLGKLVATSLSGFYGLLATFPILAVPLLLGGITSGQFWGELLVLANTFLFSLAAGMFVSVLSRDSRRAMAGTFGIILFFTGALPAVAGLVLYFAAGVGSEIAWALLLPCPIFALYQTTHMSLSAARLHDLLWSVCVTHALTWLFLALASWRVAGSWQEKPAEGWNQRWREWCRNRKFGRPAQRKKFRALLLDVNAVYWLAARARARPVYWRLLGIVAALWCAWSFKFGMEWFNEAVYFSTAILLNCTFKTWVASEAGRNLGEQRKEGALEFVLSTSLGVKEILRGQWLALRRQFLGPLTAVIAVQIIFLAASLQRESFQQNPLNPVLWMAAILMLVADVTALCWAGMWAALTVKTPNRITGVTVTRLLIAPWLLFFIVLIMANLLTMPGSPEFTWVFYVGLWFGIGLLMDLAFGVVAWRELHSKFRQLALQPFMPLSSQLARLVARVRTRVALKPMERGRTR